MARWRGLTIGTYALLMVGIVASAFVVYGYLAYLEFERVRDDMAASRSEGARQELVVAMDHLYAKAGRIADEIAQQAAVARVLQQGPVAKPALEQLVTDGVVAAAVYQVDGTQVASTPYATLPAQLTLPAPPPYVETTGGSPSLLIHRTVPGGANDGAGPSGHIALRVAILDLLREQYAFRYTAPESIGFDLPQGETLTWGELQSAVRYALRDDPIDAAIGELLTDAVLQLGAVLGVLALALFPLLVFLIVRPLRAIASHVDRLKSSPDGLFLRDLAGLVPVAETEKIRESLNDYQSRLAEVHSTLEQQSNELWEMAHHDVLTGAKNRRAFDEFIKDLPRTLDGRDVEVCFGLFDVNHFKAINDTYGHTTGDQVLKVIAGRLQAVLRRNEELFRIGGDEFAVVLVDCDEATGLQIAERCHEKIVGYDFGKLGIREPMRISAGLANARIDDVEDLQTLLWKADVAMFRAKRPGHANVVMFSEELAGDSESLFSSWVNTAVYDAVIYGTGLKMHYQPIVDVSDGKICHYEALVRIEQDGQTIEPSNIFPVIEARRLEVELDRAVIRRILADLDEGRIQPGTGVSVNLSGPTLVHDKVCTWLEGFRAFLKDYRIMIEVTETALITQIGLANDNLLKLRKQGFEIALDDFGSGYSSVRYLASMPVDVVKFDISLVQGLRDETQRKLVTHLAQLILESGPQLVAEGVEDVELLEAVRTAGFKRVQGFLTGEPGTRAHRSPVGFDNVTAFPSDRRA